MTAHALLQRRERLLGQGMPLFYSEPVHLIRGEGIWLYDASGKQYMDLYNNVPCVGHANPRVAAAMQTQAGTLNVHSRYLHESILDYAERLADLHAEPLTRTVFCCTGTEASEIALLMARAATNGRGIICTDACYHGNSTEVRRLSSAGRDPAGNPEIRAIPYPQTYRPLDPDASEAQLANLCLERVSEAIADFARNDIPLAGMFVCPLLANEGLPRIPRGFMSRAADIVRDAGGVFIADEVQAGFCRSGKWWGYETSAFVPDIVTMGKPMGAGLPLAGVVGARGTRRSVPPGYPLLQYIRIVTATGGCRYGGARRNRGARVVAKRVGGRRTSTRGAPSTADRTRMHGGCPRTRARTGRRLGARPLVERT